jgi:glycosyltransferase involved in cell wall biosynthesis
MTKRVLAIFVEPAAYRTGLVRELRTRWQGKLDVAYIARNMSQVWGKDADDQEIQYLPPKRFDALRELSRRINRSNYDIVHVAGWGHPVLGSAILLGALRSLPIVSETDTQSPRAESLLRRAVKGALYPLLLSLPTTFLPAGSRQASYLRKYRVADRSIRLGKMTVDVAAITAFASNYSPERKLAYRRRIGIPDSVKTVFLFLSRLEGFKGVQDLFDAYVRLRTRRTDVALMIAGSGSLEAFVKEAAASLRSVHFLGHLTGDDIWEAYCAADVFVLPSRREPWGLVVNEAMAAGLPVIVTDVAGCSDDLVRKGISGITVRAGDPSSLLAAMSELADHPELGRKLGGGALQVISDWTLSEEARIMATAWSAAIEQGRKGQNPLNTP